MLFSTDNSMDFHIYTVRKSTTDQIDLQDPLFSDVMTSTLTADNLFSMDPVPYSIPHRGWCRCCQCYTRHKEEQLLYESDTTSDYTSVIEPVYVWRDTLDTIINDSAAPLNPPFPPYIAAAYGIVIPDVDDEVSINTISVLRANCHVSLRCIFDSGANHHIFNDESWVMGTNSPPLTPTATFIHGISRSLQASYQCIIGHQATFICPTAKDNVISVPVHCYHFQQC